MSKLLRWAAPAGVALSVLGVWQAAIAWFQTPEYLLPAPTAIGSELIESWPTLGPAWLATLRTMGVALTLAVLGGVGMAVAFSVSRVLELSLLPYAIVLQVTPLIAMAPLLMIWVDQTGVVLIFCAWIIAFFPILASTAVGLRSADPGLRDLFDLYGATRWQRVRLLLAPTALPYFLAGLRTAVNLSLVGAVVAEFVAGSSGEQAGLAGVIFEGQYRLDTPLLFAALALVSLTGVAGYLAVEGLSRWLLGRWHESGV
ncbi:MAG: ABC transporter permease [Planctomycetota bacterium]